MPLTQIARDPSSVHTLMCSEVWASNRNVAHSVHLPGLQGWIYAAPLELGHDGGDIHYLSACDYGCCRVSCLLTSAATVARSAPSPNSSCDSFAST